MDQQQSGTPPVDFASDLEELRILFERFSTREGGFAPHAVFGQMSRAERMRHGYSTLIITGDSSGAQYPSSL
jgi:hypothetical protein